jgi:hypothetical protein
VQPDHGGGDPGRDVIALDRPATSFWLELAACRGKPTSWWFARRGDMFSVAVARSICRTCPVRLACLGYALEHDGDTAVGIFGGLSAEQRVALRRRQSGVATGGTVVSR